jgi:uncharacterized protein (DUF2235 family)
MLIIPCGKRLKNKMHMKRIITCSDGTWNKPNVIDNGKVVRTNVQKIFDYILKRDPKGITQIKYYDEGVGAEGNFLQRAFSGATGEGIDDNIKDAYKFIIWNYEKGDEIYLFGFSRGAYTARSVAGLIRKCGILINNDLRLVDQAYALYRDKDLDPHAPKVVEFRKKYCYEPEIKFIGVWDTVGALGLPLRWFQVINKRKYAFHDTTLSSIIDHAYHALAVDERRKTFEPTLWEQSKNVSNRTTPQTLEQRWFPGVHSNVGGGYPDEGLSDIALQWLVQKAAALGLAFDAGALTGDIKPNSKGTIYNSSAGIFSFSKPFIRPIDKAKTQIDESVMERMKNDKSYLPPNIK